MAANKKTSVTTKEQKKKYCVMHPENEMLLSLVIRFANILGAMMEE